MWDEVVVGGGPAGLSAATWLGRYRRRTLLLDAGEQRNRRTDEVHGYLARDPASPRDILDAGVAALGVYASVECRPVEAVALTGEVGRFSSSHLRGA